MKKKILCMALSIAMIFGLCACSEGDNNSDADKQSSLTSIDVVLDWYPNAIHAFLYDAVEEGYFEEEGLDVNIISPAESVDAISFVAAGKAQIGFTYPVEIINASENDMPVKALAAISQKALDCLCSLAENKDITSDMSCLKGKKVGYSGTSVSEATVKTIMENSGLSEGDYELINVGFDLVTSLTTKSVDLVAGTFINDEVITMKNSGYDVNVYSEQDYGVPDFYGLVMAVNSDEYENDPELYGRFLNACKKGFEDIISDKDKAMDIIMNEMNSDMNPLDEDQQSESYDILSECLETPDGEFLSMKEEKWQEMIDWMKQSGLLEKEIEAKAVFIE